MRGNSLDSLDDCLQILVGHLPKPLLFEFLQVVYEKAAYFFPLSFYYLGVDSQELLGELPVGFQEVLQKQAFVEDFDAFPLVSGKELGELVLAWIELVFEVGVKLTFSEVVLRPEMLEEEGHYEQEVVVISLGNRLALQLIDFQQECGPFLGEGPLELYEEQILHEMKEHSRHIVQVMHLYFLAAPNFNK